MKTVADVPAEELAMLLAAVDFRIRLGPMVAQIALGDTGSVAVFRHLYGRHPVAGEDEVPDFTFGIEQVRAPRFRRGLWGRMLLDGLPLTLPFEWRYSWPMFEWGLHTAVSHRGGFALMLHAAVVARNGRALILPAASGSGKSTLCALLVAAGWQFLSDEFLVLTGTRNDLVVSSLPQPIALKGPSVALVEPLFPAEDWGAGWPHASKGMIRYLRPPLMPWDAELAPGWILLPRFVAGSEETRFLPVARRDAFLAVGPNAFNYHIRGADGFRAAAELVRRSECAAIEFGDGHDAVRAIDQWTASR